MDYESGDYFDGTLDDVGLELGWKPSRHFTTDLTYDWRYYDFDETTATVRLMSLDTAVAFNAQFSLSNVVQFDNVSNNLGVNLRFRYNIRAGQDFWFVINHNMLREAETDRFEDVETRAIAKLRYTLRF